MTNSLYYFCNYMRMGLEKGTSSRGNFNSSQKNPIYFQDKIKPRGGKKLCE